MEARRKDGTIVDLPSEVAAQAFLSGEVDLPQGAAVPVMSPDGTLGTMPAEQLAAATKSGFSISSDADVARAEMEARRSTVGERAKTFAEGAANFATLGTYEAWGPEMWAEGTSRSAIEDARRAYLERGEVNPGTRFAGEMAGIAASELLTGGLAPTGEMALARAPTMLSRGLEGARALTAAPRLVTRLGGMAERGAIEALGGLEGASVLGRIGKTAVGYGARGAVESLPYAVGHAWGQYATERDLGNPDVSAGRILAGVGLETLAGGLAGGILGGGGKLIGESASGIRSRLTADSINALAQRAFGHAAPGLGEALIKTAATVSGNDASILRRLAMGTDDATESTLSRILSPEARAARKTAFFEAEHVRDEAVSKLTRDLDEVREVLDVAQDRFRGAARADVTSRMLRRDNVSQQVAANMQALDGTRQMLDELLVTDNRVWTRELNSLRKTVDKEQSLLRKAIEQGDDAAVEQGYRAIDTVKRRLQGQAQAQSKALRNAKPLVQEYGPGIIQKLDGMQDRLRLQLQDEALYGVAARAQTDVNTAWSRLISAQKNIDSRTRLYRGIEEPGVYRKVNKADAESVSRYLDTLTNPNKDATHQALRTWLQAGEDFVQAARNHGGFVGKEADKLAAFADRVSNVRKTLDETADAMSLRNQSRALTGGGGTMGLLGAAGLGAGAASLLGADDPKLGGAIGLGLAIVTDPGKVLRKLATLERLGTLAGVSGGVWNKVSAGLDKYLRVAIEGGAKAGRVGRTTLFRGAGTATREDPEDTWKRTTAAIKAAQERPEQLQQSVAHSMRYVAPDAPETTAAVVGKVSKAYEYLASKAPMQPKRPSLTPHLDEARKPSRSELIKYQRTVEAVEQGPTRLVAELNAGQLHRETVDAIKHVWPEDYETIKATIVDKLSQATKPVPREQRIRLSLLFDFAADRSLEPDFIQAMQSTYARHEPGPKPRAKSGSALKTISDTFESPTDSLEV